MAEVNSILVVVHLPVPMLDSEWDALALRLRDGDHTGVVIWANNDPPNSRQRNVMRVAVETRTRPAANVAILSGSLVIRTAVSIINVFVGNLVSMFSPKDLASAFAHARVPADAVASVTAALHRLCQQKAEAAVALAS